MNKKLIALAVAGACVAPDAMAQTANPVTLYGRVYATFESVEATGIGAPASTGACAFAPGTTSATAPSCVLPRARHNRVSDQSSLLGVRGTEDLGGGLKAFFQLETRFKPDQNDSVFADRNSGVGLQGGWGSLLLGRWDVPFKVVTGAVDVFGDLTLGGLQAATAGSGLGGISPTGAGGMDRRDQNVVQYWSPSWGGLALRASYSVNETKSIVNYGTATAPINITVDPKAYGLSLTWTGGPIYVGVAWDEQKDIRPGFTLVSTNTSNVVVTETLFPNAVIKKMTGSAVFGTFTFGPVKLGAVYEEMKRDNANALPSNAAVGAVAGFTGKQKAAMLNATFTFGNNQIMGQYQRMKFDGNVLVVLPVAPVGLNLLAEPNCKVMSGAYQYNFTRRTFVQAQYTKVDNNATATCNFGSVALPIVQGQDVKGISLGIRHIF